MKNSDKDNFNFAARSVFALMEHICIEDIVANMNSYNIEILIPYARKLFPNHTPEDDFKRTNWINTHPFNVCLANRIAVLAGITVDSESLQKAHNELLDIRDGKRF